jgi:hypothetical protein
MYACLGVKLDRSAPRRVEGHRTHHVRLPELAAPPRLSPAGDRLPEPKRFSPGLQGQPRVRVRRSGNQVPRKGEAELRDHRRREFREFQVDLRARVAMAVEADECVEHHINMELNWYKSRRGLTIRTPFHHSQGDADCQCGRLARPCGKPECASAPCGTGLDAPPGVRPRVGSELDRGEVSSPLGFRARESAVESHHPASIKEPLETSHDFVQCSGNLSRDLIDGYCFYGSLRSRCRYSGRVWGSPSVHALPFR